MQTFGSPHPHSSTLLVIDVQERLMPVIHESESIKQQINRLIQGASILSLHTIITEQYPQGLGKTCADIMISEQEPIIEKISFSCMQCDDFMTRLSSQNSKDLIICGVETHICVLKTALDAIKAGYNVFIVADAVSSRAKENKELALAHMRQMGAFIVSTEIVLFMMLQKAGSDTFKAISKLIK